MLMFMALDTRPSGHCEKMAARHYAICLALGNANLGLEHE